MDNNVASKRIVTNVKKACHKNRYNFSFGQNIKKLAVQLEVTPNGEIIKESSGFIHYRSKKYFPYKRRKCHWRKDSVLERVSNCKRYNKIVSGNANIRKWLKLYNSSILSAIGIGKD